MFNQPISSPVLVGRERELATLSALIERVKQGHGQVLLLSGEAGIGKSRLLAEGKRKASEQGFLLLQGTCFPMLLCSIYSPLHRHKTCFLSLLPTRSHWNANWPGFSLASWSMPRAIPLRLPSSQNKKNAACSWC
jgi:hypothetical protein